MSYAESITALNAKRRQIAALRDEMRVIQAAIQPEPVADYTLQGWGGPVQLSDLFGQKRDLFVIHNMGTSCRYCTLWADGFNGVYEHLADRAAFVLATPNTPEVQKEFAKSRGWRFPMVSHQGSTFARDLGYRLERGDEEGEDTSRWVPGVSAFQKDASGVRRVCNTELGPYDDFCSVWHFLDMLPERDAGWEPKFKYG